LAHFDEMRVVREPFSDLDVALRGENRTWSFGDAVRVLADGQGGSVHGQVTEASIPNCLGGQLRGFGGAGGSVEGVSRVSPDGPLVGGICSREFV
jgi:hypothetical protein